MQLSGYEDCWYYGTDTGTAQATLAFGGKDLFIRNVRLSGGQGAPVAASGSANPNRIPPGWDGPYHLTPGGNTRPVPSPF